MKRGFTLVEIMVAVMIFSVVCVVALAALVKILDANRRAQTIQDAVVGMSFTLESLTREVRSGSSLYCTTLSGSDMIVPSLLTQGSSGCGGVTGGSGVGFAFLSSKVDPTDGCNLIIAYEIIPSGTNFTMKKATQQNCSTSIGASDFEPVIDANNVTLTNYYLYMIDKTFPYLYFKLDGIAGSKDTAKTYFTLQTATSPRVP